MCVAKGDLNKLTYKGSKSYRMTLNQNLWEYTN